MNEEEAILRQDRVGQKVAIIGAARGAEIAVSLANGGREVVILEAGASAAVLGASYVFGNRRLALARMVQHPSIKLLSQVEVKEISDGGVSFVDQSGARGYVEAETVIVALGRTANKEMEKAAGQVAEEVITVGDASRPMNQLNSIHDGFFAAYGIGDPKGLEASRLAQISRLAAEQTRIPGHGTGMELEWGYATSLPTLVPGREVRRQTQSGARADKNED